MYEIRETEPYSSWFSQLKDRSVMARIDIRLRRFSMGNPGIVKSVGEGVNEIKFDIGPGYRVYFVYRGSEIVILLGGGDKSTQAKDIKAAQKLALALKDGK